MGDLLIVSDAEKNDVHSDEEERPVPAEESSAGKALVSDVKDARSLKKVAVALGALCVLFAGASAVKLFGGTSNASPTAPAEHSPEPDAAPAKGTPPAQASTTSKKKQRGGNYFLASRGAKASGCERPEVMIDGNSTDYDNGNGYSSYDMNNKQLQGCVVTLPKPVDISRIRFLLWDKDDRSYTYQAFISPDGKTWKMIEDASNKQCKSWQDLRFTPQSVQAVRIKGLTSTANSYFHLVEIEGYDDGPVVPLRKAPKDGALPSIADLRPGLWAEYYDDIEGFPTIEDKPLLERPETKFDFGSMPPAQAPGQGLKGWPMAGACSAVFSGYLKIDKQDLYTFFLVSDDGSKLYIDGDLLIDNDGFHGMTELWGQLDLSPGLHRIWMCYFNAGGPMGLQLHYKPKGDDRKAIPPEMVFHNPAEKRRP